MHRAHGGRLGPSLTPHTLTPSHISRRFSNSTTSSRDTTKTTKRWNNSAFDLLKRARPHRPGLVLSPSRRSTELTLVNAILEEGCLPAAAKKGLPDVVRHMGPHLDEDMSELPPGVGPCALVEVRWWVHLDLLRLIVNEVFAPGRSTPSLASYSKRSPKKGVTWSRHCS